jgi:N-acetylglucosamine-6-sulfatase
MCNDNMYFGNAFNVNGTMVTAPKDTYLTNHIGNASLAWLAEAVAAAPARPFFAYIAPHAPHVPATPAHEYENAPLPGGNETAPRTPSWNYGTAHHHWLVSQKETLSPKLIDFSDQLFARRLRATMSVDDIIASVVQLLTQSGQLENTFILYSSDHGYDLGQFRLPSGKFNAYENCIRVPFFVRGPGVSAGLDLPSVLVNNVDIGATVLELAQVAGRSSYVSDGTSFASQLSEQGRAQAAWQRDRLLFEYWGMGYTERGPCSNGTSPCPGGVQALEDAPSNSWSGLRIVNATHDLMYAEYRPDSSTPLLPGNTNFTVAFNMTEDPFQLVNQAGPLGTWTPQLLQQLSKELWQIATCQQGSCP